jgi:zinc transporter ZupT
MTSEPHTSFMLSAFLAACLALVHLLADKIDCLDGKKRSFWLSFSSGVSVSYVFVFLLPDLSKKQDTISATKMLDFLDKHAYLLALLGSIVFYELEQIVRSSQATQLQVQSKKDSKIRKDDTTGNRVFWLHIISFTAYNTLVGYLLVQRETPRLRDLLLYALAMGLHFFVNDRGLYRTHRSAYRHIGRWLLAAATAIGWFVGVYTKVSEALLAILFSFLGGGVVLNVLKEELQKNQRSHFGAFASGAIAYSTLLSVL